MNARNKKILKNTAGAVALLIAVAVFLLTSIDIGDKTSLEDRIDTKGTAKNAKLFIKPATGRKYTSFNPPASSQAAKLSEEQDLVMWLTGRGGETNASNSTADNLVKRQSDSSKLRARFFNFAKSSALSNSMAQKFLQSEYSVLRAVGAVKLFLNGNISSDQCQKLVNDPEVMVPLAVFDCMRERATSKDLSYFRQLVAERQLDENDIKAMLSDNILSSIGERSLLDILSAVQDEDARENLIDAFAQSPNVSEDACWQALLMQQYSVDNDEHSKSLDDINKRIANDDANGTRSRELEQFSAMLALSKDDEAPYRVYDVQVKDVEFLSNKDTVNPTRALANYIENALFRTGAVIEEGSYDVVKKYLDTTRDNTPEREWLETLLERIKALDPTYETDDEEEIWRELDDSWPNVKTSQSPNGSINDDDDDQDDDDQDDEDQDDDDQDDDDQDDDDQDDDDQDDDDQDDDDQDNDDQDDGSLEVSKNQGK